MKGLRPYDAVQSISDGKKKNYEQRYKENLRKQYGNINLLDSSEQSYDHPNTNQNQSSTILRNGFDNLDEENHSQTQKNKDPYSNHERDQYQSTQFNEEKSTINQQQLYPKLNDLQGQRDISLIPNEQNSNDFKFKEPYINAPSQNTRSQGIKVAPKDIENQGNSVSDSNKFYNQQDGSNAQIHQADMDRQAYQTGYNNYSQQQQFEQQQKLTQKVKLKQQQKSYISNDGLQNQKRVVDTEIKFQHMNMVNLRFYCNHSSLPGYKTLYLFLKIEYDHEKNGFNQYLMKKIEIDGQEETFYVDVEINQDFWHGKTLKYYYQIDGTVLSYNSKLIARRYVEFKNSRIFYDTPPEFSNKVKSLYSKEVNIGKYYDIFLRSNLNKNYDHGSILNFEQFFIFLKNCNFSKQEDKRIQKLMIYMEEILAKIDYKGYEFVEYCLEIIGFLVYQGEVYKEIKTYFISLSRHLLQIDLTTLYKLNIVRLQDKELLNIRQKSFQYIFKAIKELGNVNAIFLLMFVTNRDIVEKVNDLFDSVQIQTSEQNFPNLCKVVYILCLYLEEGILKKNLRTLLLLCVKSFDQILLLEDNFLKETQNKLVYEQIQALRQQYKNDFYFNDWMKNKLDQILQKESLRNVLNKEIQLCIQQNTNRKEFAKKYENVLNQYPDLVGPSSIKDFAQFADSAHQIQSTIKMIQSNLKSQQPINAEQISEIMYIIFANRMKYQQSLTIIQQAYLEQIKLHHYLGNSNGFIQQIQDFDIIQVLIQKYGSLLKFHLADKINLDSLILQLPQLISQIQPNFAEDITPFIQILADVLADEVQYKEEFYKILNILPVQCDQPCQESVSSMIWNSVMTQANQFVKEDEDIPALINDKNYNLILAKCQTNEKFDCEYLKQISVQHYQKLVAGKYQSNLIKRLLVDTNYEKLKSIFSNTFRNFDPSELEKIKEYNQEFTQQLDRIELYKAQLQQIKDVVNIKELQKYQQDYKTAQENLQLSELMKSKEGKILRSLIMPKIHQDLQKSKVYNDMLADYFTQVQLKAEQNKATVLIPIQEFDKQMYAELIEEKLESHIMRLAYYPDEELEFNQIKFWIQMSESQIKQELILFSESKNLFQKNRTQIEFKKDLVRDFNILSLLSQTIKDCQSFIKLKFLQNYSCIQNNSENFDTLDNFINFCQKIEQQSIKLIVSQIIKVRNMLQNAESQDIIDFNPIKELCNAKELIKFCLENQGINWNDLNDGLDDSELEDRSILSDMNLINQFINKLLGTIQNKNKIVNFKSLLLCVTTEIEKQERNDHHFQFRLKNCILNLENLKTICQSQLHTQENTIKIVIQITQEGIAEFRIQGEKCIFKIGYGEGKEIDNEKINNYCARAILMSHNRRTSVREDDTYSMISDQFAIKVKLFQDIKKVISELSQNGHLDFANNYLKQFHIPDNTPEQLQKELIQFREKLNKWKQFLNLLRIKYYYMTFIPNSKFQIMTQYLTGQIHGDIQTESIFKFINPLVNANRVMSQFKPINNDALDSYEDLMDECSKRISDIFSEMEQEKRDMFYEPALADIKARLITPGIVKVYQIKNNLENIKAIASIFCVAKYYPQMSQIMFCTRRTKQYEVECFIMRAILFNKKRAQKQERVYILSNFQKLQLSIQIEAVKFLEKMTEDLKNLKYTDFNLIILQTVDQKNSEYLVEEMQQKPAFNPYFVDDKYLIRFFSCVNTHLVSSNKAGLGKSTFIRSQIERMKSKYINIPFQGDLSKEKIYHFHEKKLHDVNDNQKLGFHYTINPSQGEDVNIILFELLMFGGINDGDKFIYQIPHKNKCSFIELSQDIKKDHDRNLFFYLLQNQTNLEWSIENVNVSQEQKSYAQLVLKSIKMVNMNDFKNEIIDDPQQVIRNDEARVILKKEFFQDITDPNFYMLDSYLAFAGDQISQLNKSGFFSLVYLNEQFGKNKSGQLLTNFVKSILSFSKKICIMTKSMANQQLSISQNKIGSINNEEVKGMDDVQWNFSKEAFITFNDDGSVTPVFREFEQLPEFIQQYYKTLLQILKNYINIQQPNLKKLQEETKLETESFENLSKISPEKIIEKIFKICGRDYEEFKKLKKGQPGWFDQHRLAFTADNFLKMNFVFLRLRSRQPVTIMGETGVGKTALIEYLKDVMQWSYQKLNIHEGITEQKIIEFVQNANQNSNSRVILFLDEVNTNFNVSGLLKEIMVDRTLNGEKIGDHISIVAACNPYKLKLENSVKRQFTSGIKHNRINQLSDNVVYKVHPLPESIFPFVQDYGALQLEEQEKYIYKIIDRIQNEIKQVYSQDILKFISQIVFQSHAFIHKKSSSSSVSLRDVDRFRKLYGYFYKNNYLRDGNELNINEEALMRRVLVLTFTVCYKLSFGSKELRFEYDEFIRQIKVGEYQLDSTELARYVKQEQDRYVDHIEIPKGIGKNESLKENIFSMITMILNKIPLFITGKPGSSKTLAMNLVLKSMKGNSSQSEFFKQFPALQPFNYQGSIQSTSAGIERIFDRSHQAFENHRKKKQESSDKISDVIYVVVIDEIGLAELSPHNPLKVLHSFLEMFLVGFVGISNWALDDSKRNRGINLSKPDPTINDLRESAESQFYEICCGSQNNEDIPVGLKSNNNNHLFKMFKDNYLDKLVNFYQSYYQKQTIQNFHGLRDFYQLICQVSYKMRNNENPIIAIVEGVQRNFGGQRIEEVMKYLQKAFPDEELIQEYDKMKPSLLISENLADQLARNLMVISDHEETITLRYIEEICYQNNRLYQIFYGSNFEKDKREEAIYQVINDIILCMESGKIVILLNLENIYQAFYDMLNQNYQVLNGQKRCKVAIGPDSSRCIVHDDFKCILLVSSESVKKMDAPLLNRFEKHYYNDFENLSDEEKNVIENLIDWMKNCSKFEQFKHKDMFPVLSYSKQHLQNSLTSLVLFGQSIDYNNFDFILDFCKKSILSLSNQSSVLRSKLTKSEDQDILVEYYQDAECHTDVLNMIQNYQSYWDDDSFFKGKDEQSGSTNLGFNVCVYTYSPNLLGYETLYDELNVNPKAIMVEGILSKDEFENQIKEFFQLDQIYSTLLIVADSLKHINNTLSLCRSIINQCRNQYKMICKDYGAQNPNFEAPLRNVVFIVKVYGLYNANICFGPGWKETFIDLANGQGSTNIHVDKFLNYSMRQIIGDDEIFRYIFELSIPNSVSLIKYQNKDKDFKFEQRVWLISDILLGIEQLQNMCKEVFSQMITVKDNINLDDLSWKYQAVRNREIMNQSLSFHSAAINYIKSLIGKNIGYVIFLLEDMNLIDVFNENKKDKKMIDTLLAQFKEIFNSTFKNQPLKPNYIIKSSSKSKYPFFQYLIEKFESVRDLIIQQMKQLDIQISHDFVKIEEMTDQIKQIQSDLVIGEEEEKADREERRFSNDELNQKREQMRNLQDSISQDLRIIHNLYEERYHEINKQILQNFTTEQQNNGILRIKSSLFTSNLSYYLGQDVNHQFYEQMFQLLFTKRSLESNQIYSIYLLYQDFIEQVQIILDQFRTYIQDDALFTELNNQILQLEEETNKNYHLIEQEENEEEKVQINTNLSSSISQQLHPKYVLKLALIKTVYQLLLPTKKLINQLSDNNLPYEDLMHQVLSNLENFNVYQKNDEISMIQFFIRYKQKVINKIPNKTMLELVDIVSKISKMDNAIQKIDVIIDLNDEDIQEQNSEVNSQEERESQDDEEEHPFIDEELKNANEEEGKEGKKQNNQEDKKEEEESEEENSDEDYQDGAEESDTEKHQRIVCEFIFSYLEDEFDKIPESEQDQYTSFCLNALKVNYHRLKRKPLLGHGIMRKIIRQIQKTDSEVFLRKASLEYDELIQENQFINILDKFLQKIKFAIEKPFTIILTDLIGEVISEKIGELNENLRVELLTNQLETSLNSSDQNPILKRIIAVAYVRVALQIAASRMILCFNNAQGVPDNNPLINCFDRYFQEEQIEKVKPYIFYLFKVMNQIMDYDTLMGRLYPRFTWILGIRKQEQQNRRMFKVLSQKKNEHQSAIYVALQNRAQFAPVVENAVLKYKLKLLVLQVVAQEFYLNNAIDRIDTVQNMQQLLSNQGRGRQIMELLCSGSNNYTNMQDRVLNAQKGVIGELLVYAMTTFIPLDDNNFFKHMLINPLDVAQTFIPFIVNTTYDLNYSIFLNANENFARYACIACGYYFFVGDCGALSNHRTRNAQVNVGGTRCKCGQLVGFGAEANSRLIDRGRNKTNFSPETDAVPDFIFQEVEVYDGMDLRGMNALTKIIGQILTNLMILGALLLSDENTQNQIQRKYAPDQQNQNITKGQHCLDILIKNLRFNCEKLKQLINRNDDQIKLLLEHIIQNISLKCEDAQFQNRLSITNLNVKENRKAFELFFQQECLPNQIENNFTEFFNETQEVNLNVSAEFIKNASIINETYNYKDNDDLPLRQAYMHPLLRVQGDITLDRFNQFLKTNITVEGNFLLKTISQIQSLETLRYFNDMIAWLKFMSIKLDGKVSYEDSLQLEIGTIIDRTFKQEKERKYAYEQFDKFEIAWNEVNAVADIRDGCDEIIIPRMSRKSLFQLICLSNVQKDTLGVNFYYLIKYLSELQNTFIQSISVLEGYEYLEDIFRRQVKFMDLKPYQIISETINEEIIIRELKQISLNKIQYGQGRNVDYNVEKLSEKFFNLLLKNKVAINCTEEESPYTYTFENLTNPYNQFVEIQEAIVQVPYGNPYQVIENMRSFEDRYNLLKDLQTTLNFIQQTKGDQNTNLKQYMQSFKIQSSGDIDEGIKLTHVLDFYEHVEDSLQARLVQSANNMYQQSIRDLDEDIIRDCVSKHQEKLTPSKNILGRFIIRQLCYTTQMPDQISLFQMLFDEYNSYLFGIGQVIDTNEYQRAYKRSQVVIGQSFHTYRHLAQLIRDQEIDSEEQKRQKEETLKKNIERMKNANQGQANEDNGNDQNLADLIAGSAPAMNEQFFNEFNNTSSEDEGKKNKKQPKKDVKKSKPKKAGGLKGMKMNN